VGGCLALVAVLGWAATLVDRAGTVPFDTAPFDEDGIEFHGVDVVDRRSVA
jgi:hypothetical protein